MTEVLVAIIGGLALVVVAAISERTRQHAKAAREQVQNSHNVNLRDDLDRRFDRLDARLERIASGLDARLVKVEREHRLHRRPRWWQR